MQAKRNQFLLTTVGLVLVLMIGLSAAQLGAAEDAAPAERCPVVGDVCQTDENCGPNPDCYCNAAAQRCRSASATVEGNFGG